MSNNLKKLLQEVADCYQNSAEQIGASLRNNDENQMRALREKIRTDFNKFSPILSSLPNQNTSEIQAAQAYLDELRIYCKLLDERLPNHRHSLRN